MSELFFFYLRKKFAEYIVFNTCIYHFGNGIWAGNVMMHSSPRAYSEKLKAVSFKCTLRRGVDYKICLGIFTGEGMPRF